jgi:ParB family chromosome partitioning protein
MRTLARLLGLSSEKPEIVNPAEFSPVDQINAAVVADIADLDQPQNIHEIHQAAIGDIVPNPFQPRKSFNEEALQELAASIQEFGVIQPLLVRRIAGGFELVAGERRLRASKLAGLNVVPVIVKELNDQEMAELAMIENLQREDLHYLEEAEGFQLLIANFGFTQEEMAKRVGKNQSTIANKMRLLKLEPEVRAILITENLTERHARSLLKINDPKVQMDVLDAIRQKGLNVRETEGLIEEILEDISREMSKKAKPKQNTIKVIRDVRIFINTINHVVSEMKKAGLKIKANQEQDDDYITIQLKIPKRR